MSRLPLSVDTELYRQQLEARARIYYSTSEIWLRVAPGADGRWVADLHERSADAEGNVTEDAELAPCPGYPSGQGRSAESALEEFAEQLDARERAEDSIANE